MTNKFIVVGLRRLVIKPKSIATEADDLSLLIGPELLIKINSCFKICRRDPSVSSLVVGSVVSIGSFNLHGLLP